jgi:hypothetical protein
MISKEAQEQHPRLVKLIEAASSSVEQIFAKAGSVASMFHYVKNNGDHIVTLAPVHLEKDEGFELMRTIFAIENAVAVMFIGEAWTFVADINEARAHVESGRSAVDHPRRIEIVTFEAEDSTGTLSGRRTIERPAGKRPQLGPLEIETSKFATGRLVGMLPKPSKATLQ